MSLSSNYLFPPPAQPSLAIEGSEQRFPVHRIYCVGRNFVDHAREMGAEVDRGSPLLFCKPADAVVPGGGAIPYPSATQDLHHEVELVVAIGGDHPAGELSEEQAASLIFGYSVGIDLTRRDLQARAKAKSGPWDTAKGFDASAPIGSLIPVAVAGELSGRRLWLRVNGSQRQSALLDDMVWSVESILVELATLFAQRAGDLVFMGTSAGVAALAPGDHFEAGIEGWVELQGQITPR